MLLDPPDPVDLLIAHTHADEAVNLGARPLDASLTSMAERMCWHQQCCWVYSDSGAPFLEAHTPN